MKIAVVEKSSLESQRVRKAIEERARLKGWVVNYFQSGKDLLSEDSCSYDAVLVDHGLKDDSDKLILNVITDEKIDIAIMNGPASTWNDLGLVQDDQVNALIDKTDPTNVVDWLNYVDVKHRMTGRIKEESGIYSEIVSNTNGCLFDIQEEVTVLGISRLLSKERIDTITKSIELTNNKIVLYFTPDVRLVTSSYFGLLVTFWERVVKERGGKMAFWMRDSDDTLIQLANLFCINELFPCFAEIDDAIRYVKVAEYNEKRKRNNECSKRSYA